MRTLRLHLRYAAMAVLLAAVASPAGAVLYEFRINSSVGLGDPALSQAVRGASGDIYVLVPLQSVTVPGFPGARPTLVFHGPPPGVVVTTPSHEYDINFGGSLPFCFPGGGPCVSALGVVYVSLVQLTSDVWGRFEGGMDGSPLVWVPNPDPGNHGFHNSFTAPPDLFVPFPGTFSMAPVIPEPPIAALLALALCAAGTRSVMRTRSIQREASHA